MQGTSLRPGYAKRLPGRLTLRVQIPAPGGKCIPTVEPHLLVKMVEVVPVPVDGKHISKWKVTRSETFQFRNRSFLHCGIHSFRYLYLGSFHSKI